MTDSVEYGAACSNANYTIHNQARVYPPDQENPKDSLITLEEKRNEIPFLPGMP